MPHINIYSQNICWTKSQDSRIKIAKYINKHQPDIVCLQEVVFDYHLKPFDLAGYHKSNYKIPILPNAGGLLILSKVKPKSINFFKYHNQGKVNSIQLAERLINKGFLVVDFGEFTLINTHLVASHGKPQKVQDKANSSQLIQLLEYIKIETNIHKSKKVILVGDLNFDPKSVNYSFLKNRLHDYTANIPITFNGYKSRLDYICANFEQVENSLSIQPKIKTVTYLFGQPSDHYGLIAKLTI